MDCCTLHVSVWPSTNACFSGRELVAELVSVSILASHLLSVLSPTLSLSTSLGEALAFSRLSFLSSVYVECDGDIAFVLREYAVVSIPIQPNTTPAGPEVNHSETSALPRRAFNCLSP